MFFPYVVAYVKNLEPESLTWVSGIMLIIGVPPPLALHLNYYFINKGDVFGYMFQERTIVFTHKGETSTFTLDEIDHIERFMSFNFAAGRSSFLAWDDYNHTVIYLKNGQKFVVTSLLVYNLNLPLEGKKIIVKKGFYRWAKAVS